MENKCEDDTHEPLWVRLNEGELEEMNEFQYALSTKLVGGGIEMEVSRRLSEGGKHEWWRGFWSTVIAEIEMLDGMELSSV